MSERVFIATTGRGLARAAVDAQGGWEVESLLDGQRVNCLASDPVNPASLYAGTQGDGVLHSEDRGRSWHSCGLDGVVVKSLAISPHQPGTIYAGCKPAHIYVTHDGGDSWAELDGFRRVPGRWFWLSPAEPPFKAYVLGLALSPTDPDVIVTGIEAGAVVRSADGGRTWSGHCKKADRDCHTLTFHTSDGNWIYEGGGGGPAVSQDGGQTWRHPTAGMEGSYCWACAADPERPDVWYVSASPGFSWSKFRPVAHVDGDARAAIYRSSGGGTWEKLGGGLPQPLDYMAYGLVTLPQDAGHLYAGLANGDVWHTADYGDTWPKLPFNLGGIHRYMIVV